MAQGQDPVPPHRRSLNQSRVVRLHQHHLSAMDKRRRKWLRLLHKVNKWLQFRQLLNHLPSR